MPTITIVGGGLAGCEAAWQAARRGARVRLLEMKPRRFSPAHKSEALAELVCSNSLRSDSPTNAAGLLKAELEALGSLIMEGARATAVGAGGALAVDREGFSRYVTEKLAAHPNVELERAEALEIPDGIAVIATGPLTSEGLMEKIRALTGSEDLFFYDASAPIVEAASIDMERAFFASRYGKGEASDYINCPMSREEYDAFWEALTGARRAELRDFDAGYLDAHVFEGCMPIEVMAARGRDTLRFGPLKPIGITDPSTGRRPWAVAQLRRDNSAGTMYNLVGFQTNLAFGEQKRVFSMIPALAHAEFLRYGVMHRNTYINSPRLLEPSFRLRGSDLFFAGQLTGVEGYLESAASGLAAGIAAASVASGREPPLFPRFTAIGALAAYISDPSLTSFSPMNVNYGIIEYPADSSGKKLAVKERIYERSMEWLKNNFLQGETK